MRAYLRCIMAGLVFTGVLVLHGGGLVDPGAVPVAHAQRDPRHPHLFYQPKTSGEPMSCRTSGIALLIYLGIVVTIVGMIKSAAQGGRDRRGRGGRRARGSRSRGGWSRHRRGR